MVREIASYPLRMPIEIRNAVQKMANENERSLNWQLNQLVKIGLQSLQNSGAKDAAH